MSFRDKLDEIDSLQQSIENHGKLGKELLQKINYKFRLDWNYYSNRMEGNTLTLDETKSVMIGNINVHNKPLKDIMEMKGHDEVVQMILKMGKGELNISEGRIRSLHKEIMYEEHPAEKAKLGEWKKQSNHVYNYREEKFEFTDPSEVSESMHALINWVNLEREKITSKRIDRLHPVELAFEFHLRYLTIHPFYDGNGRTARILSNLILISNGYPAIYIKDNEKQFYYRYLADVQGYGAEKSLLFELMSSYLIRSLNIIVDAIAGKEIEEAEDLDKKIQLLQRELSPGNDDFTKTRFSKAILLQIYDDWLSKLIVATIQTAEKFTKFFSTNKFFVDISNSHVVVQFEKDNLHGSLNRFRKQICDSPDLDSFPHILEISASFSGMMGHNIDELEKLNAQNSIVIKFTHNKYQVSVGIFDEKLNRLDYIKIFERWLDESVTDGEVVDISSKFGNSIFNIIDYRTRKYGLRK
jgi:Fic family protein